MNMTSRENASKKDDRIDKLADQISTLVEIVSKKVVTPATVKVVEESCVTYGGNHAYYNCDATNSNQSSVYAATGTYNRVAPQNRASNFMASPVFSPVQNNSQNSGFFQNQTSTLGTLSSNTIPNPKGEMKAITTCSGVAYEGPSIPTNQSPKKVVERETEETTDKEQTNFQGSTAHIQPPVVPISEPDVLKTLPKPNIPYPSRLNDQKLREKATNQMEKFFQDLHFDISFADALLLIPKFAFTIKSLLANKDKLFELSKITLNENCSAMLLKKLPEKLGDPGKFLIPSDRSITRPKGVVEDVFVKVGKFYFPTDFEVVDFEADPRVPLILGRSFLRTGRALIDVYGEEITLWVNDKAVTFILNQTTRYSSTYDDMSVNRIDVIDVTREEYAQEMFGFSNNSSGGNPTSTSEPIISDSSPSLTSFEGSDFILEEIEAYLKDESISSEIDHADCDLEEDICLIEKLLNDDPYQLPPMDLKQGEVVKAKSSIKEPLDLKLKDLPSHLQYAYLEGVDKLPVIIAKDLKDDEKEALLKVLKAHKWSIAWKITDIKGIDPRFCTHKILMEEDYKPMVQSQRRVNPKIHEVIKKEVIKLLDAGMIYLISDSSWVSPIHCVPKKGGIIVVENENNELIPIRLVTVKGVRSFLGHVGFYRRFIQDFFKIARPMTHLLKKETPFVFSKDCIDAFETLKKKITDAPILVVPDWNLPFELMCDASNFAIDAVLGQYFIGPFPSSQENSYILVSVDYLSKWVEAKALPTNDARVAVKLLKSLFARFGTPKAIISYRGTYFCNDKFAKVMSKYEVTHRLATAYHLQISGHVEVSNRGLKRILKRTVGENCAS
nr:reverse transcriptase domain-containing protein [Tanacetum cinerariifolium]